MADQSIWKKEVSFVRKSDEQAPEPDESERPVWKQELSFVRKLMPLTDTDETAAQEPAADEQAAESAAWPVPEPEIDPEEPVEEHEQEPAQGADLSLVPGADSETGLDERSDEPAPVVGRPLAAAPVESENEIGPQELDEEPDPAPAVELPVAALAPVESEPQIGPEQPVDEEPVWMRAVTFGSKAAQTPTNEEVSDLNISGDDSSHVPGTVPETGFDQPVAEAESKPEPEDAPAETSSALAWLPPEPTLSEPEAEATRRSANEKGLPLLVGGCAALLVASLLGALFMIGSGRTASARRNLADLNRQVEALAPLSSGGRQQLAGAQRARASALTAALARRISWDRVVRDISLALPHDVRPTSLTATSAGGGAVPPMFTIRGRTSSHQRLASLLSRLRADPDLTNVQLISSTRPKVAGRPVEFTIAADVAAPAGGGS